MSLPARLRRQAERHALVDGIPFRLPVNSERSPAVMAAFPCDPGAARRLLPGNELHPLRFRGRALLLVTVIDYRVTDIGKYIEYSIGIACTHGARPAPPLLPLLLRGRYGLGQYVLDLPVSTEVSVKGGKGIWGMPKHRASLDFLVDDDTVSSQYDLDGRMVVRLDVARPRRTPLRMNLSATNYCAFRGLLMKSYVHFGGRVGFALGRRAAGRLAIGDHPRAEPLRTLGIAPAPVFTAFFPESAGVLDDHFEAWFLTYDRPPEHTPEGLESVVGMGLSEEWPDPPVRQDRPAAGAQGAPVAARAGDGA